MSRRLLIGLFVALVVLSVSCGDDGDGASADTSADATEEGSGADAGSGDAPQSDLDGFFTGDCAAAVRAFNDALASAGTAFVPGAASTPEDTAELLDDVAGAAPDEIADDFAVLADAYGELAEVLADSGIDLDDPESFDDPDAIAALLSLDDIFDEEELNEASDNIQAWFAANCA